MDQRVLALDVSTKTGWTLMVSSDNSYVLEAYGQIPRIEMPDGLYPGSYVDWAYACFSKVLDLVDEHHPDVLIIEETSKGSKDAHSQKILEFIHFLIAKMIKETGVPVRYYMTEEWRRECGCLMTKAEKDRNKAVKKSKEKSGTKVAYDANGKRIGKVGRKHVNVRRANEIFGPFLREPLRKKDEDTADALLLAFCFHAKKIKFASAR